MVRLLATYTLVPGRGLLINHITTLDDDSRFVACEPLTKELSHTRFVTDTLLLLSADQSIPDEHATTTFSALFAAMPELAQGTPVKYYSMHIEH